MTFPRYILLIVAFIVPSACADSGGGPPATDAGSGAEEAHSHGVDGHEHEGEDPAHGEEEHGHAEESLGTVEIGGLSVELAQGHGGVVAGAESHLVVKLPYSDAGATVVRAWIGTEDRLSSYVGKGEYAPSHDDYDIHATAPDPLPANPMWWIELERPDGTTVLGSAKPLMK